MRVFLPPLASLSLNQWQSSGLCSKPLLRPLTEIRPTPAAALLPKHLQWRLNRVERYRLDQINDILHLIVVTRMVSMDTGVLIQHAPPL